MFFLAALLSFGWPPERTVWVPPQTPVPSGLVTVRLNDCCGSMRPAIRGGELAYAEPYQNQTGLVGCIISTPEFTHRVTVENRRAVRTAGDANHYSDHWTDKKNIRYIIRFIVRQS